MSITIDSWMMRELDLSGNELIVFALICEAGKEGVSVSKPMLAFLTNTSVATVRRVLGKLSKRGYIERTHVGENEPSTWVACIDEGVLPPLLSYRKHFRPKRSEPSHVDSKIGGLPWISATTTPPHPVWKTSPTGNSTAG